MQRVCHFYQNHLHSGLHNNGNSSSLQRFKLPATLLLLESSTAYEVARIL